MSLPVVAAILLLVAACTAGILVYFNNDGSAHKAGGSSCDGKVTIFLDAAPSIADPVEAIAKKWVATNPTAGSKCVAVNMNSLPSANVEQILASTIWQAGPVPARSRSMRRSRHHRSCS